MRRAYTFTPQSRYRWQLGLLWAGRPRSLHTGRPSSRRAAAVRISRTQLETSPEPFRRAAISAACRMSWSVSDATRTRSITS